MPHHARSHHDADFDVIVVGGGNAGFCAGHAALEQGARALIIEKGDATTSGGNSFYTAGAFRVVHGGSGAVGPVVDEETRARLSETELAPYSVTEFESDMRRITEGRGDSHMARLLAADSSEIVGWLMEKGIRWRLMYERQAYQTNGKWVFFGGLALGSVGGGKGLVAQHTDGFTRAGGQVRYATAMTDLIMDANNVVGVRVKEKDGGQYEIHSRAVVLAAGGFEADPNRRRQHLGSGWEQALVRGNPLNTGEVLDRALSYDAARHGDWSSCHSVAIDAGSPPDGGDRALTNQRTRQSYPIGLVVNRDGQRFIDEGADYRNYTYAKYGSEILRQPGGVAFQLFDAQTRPLLRAEEYDSSPITGAAAGSLHELAAELGIDRPGLLRTVEDFNASIVQRPFNPTVKDGRAARVHPPKSNWAMELNRAPFYGYAVSCGITFTFGGVRVDDNARVIRADGSAISGLYAAGEMVGGLFSGNYPGGSGLTAGAVYGRRAGAHAGSLAKPSTGV